MLGGTSDVPAKSNGSVAATKAGGAIERTRREAPKRCALFDAQPLRGEGLACWLRAANSKCIVSTFRNIDQLCSNVESEATDLIFFSVCEAEFQLVLDALDRLARASLSTPSVVVSAAEHPGAAIEFLRRGARGFIPTSLDLIDASAVLDFISAGGTFLPAALFLNPSLSVVPSRSASDLGVSGLGKGYEIDQSRTIAPSRAATPWPAVEFTDREAKVLECICRGRPNKLIAHELALCESTVKMYVGRLMRKLNATNRTELALVWEKFVKAPAAATDRMADPPAGPATPPVLCSAPPRFHQLAAPNPVQGG